MANSQNNSGQGRVKDPENDGRLKQNNGGQQGQGKSSGSDDGRSGSHGQGSVTNPEHDGRLKQNR